MRCGFSAVSLDRPGSEAGLSAKTSSNCLPNGLPTRLEHSWKPQANHHGLLGQLQELRTLDLGRSPFNDAGCLCLPLLTKLRTLNLPDTRITDAGLVSIAALADLDTLDIRGNKAITDVGITHIERLKHLELVNAFDTSASQSGVAGLREAIPGVEVAVVVDESNPFLGIYKSRNPRGVGSAFGLSEWQHQFAD